MQLVARWISYTLLAIMCLFLAGVAYGMGGLFGAGAGAVLFNALHVLAPPAARWQDIFKMSGALLGGGCSLIWLARLWIAQAQGSDDQGLRDLGDYLDELRLSLRRPC